MLSLPSVSVFIVDIILVVRNNVLARVVYSFCKCIYCITFVLRNTFLAGVGVVHYFCKCMCCIWRELVLVYLVLHYTSCSEYFFW